MEDRQQLKATKAHLAATGIPVADLEVVAFRPDTVVASFEAFMETGRELGARHTLVAAYDPDLDRFPIASPNIALWPSLRSHRRSRIHALDLRPRPADRIPYHREDAVARGRRPGRCPALRPIAEPPRRPRQAFSAPAALLADLRRACRTAGDDGSHDPCCPRGTDVPRRRRHRPDRPCKGDPADTTISIEVPTATLARTVDAQTRAARALSGARAVIAAARAAA